MDTSTIPDDKAQAEADIRALEAAYDEAWRVPDIDAILDCMTKDAVVVNPRGEVARGHSQIRRMLGDFLHGPGKGSEHVSEISQVEFVAEHVAIVDGHAIIDGLQASDSFQGVRVRHLFTDVLVKRKGAWKISQVRACSVITDS